MKVEKGEIVEIHRNYGYIRPLSNPELTYPFEIKEQMVIGKKDKKFFSFSKLVTFKKGKVQGIRGKDRIFVAENLQPIGEENISQELLPSASYTQSIRTAFKKFSISIPDDVATDDSLYEWLKDNGFQPRMLDYLRDGLLYSSLLSNLSDVEINKTGFSVDDIVRLDLVDQEFRGRIMKWIVGIEDSCKSLISRLSSNDYGKVIANSAITAWKNKNSKGEKQYKRAIDAKKFSLASDNYDYVFGSVPIEDLMLQLDLSELPEFLKIWKKAATTTHIRAISPALEFLIEATPMLDDLGQLRNAAAHGRALIPSFMDPDFNPNWDLEFDTAGDGNGLNQWQLLHPLQNVWLSNGISEEVSRQNVQTIFGNPYRRAWVELNYIYVSLIPMINVKQAKRFMDEAEWFLDYSVEPSKDRQPINLRLVDMGDLTYFSQTHQMPPAYREIANEAQNIWNS